MDSLVLRALAAVSLLHAAQVQAITATTTTLKTSATTYVARCGGPATLTAAVTGASPTGNVTFNIVGYGPIAAPVPVSGGQAVLVLDPVPPQYGYFSLQAAYSGDANNAASTSSAVDIAITKLSPGLSLKASQPAYAGQPLTLTVKVSGCETAGQVTIKEGATVLGTPTLVSGPVVSQATLPVTLNGLSHTLTASYPGGPFELPASASLNLQLAIAQPASPAPVRNYEYDAQGNLTKAIRGKDITGFNFSTGMAYDRLDRLIAETDPLANPPTQYGYDGQDRITSVTDPRKLVTGYQRTGLGQLTQLSSPDTGVANATYDAAGNLLTRTDSTGAKATYTYDELDRLTSVVYSKAGSTYHSYGWTYDQTGTGFSNGIGRLTTQNFPGGSTRYAYNAQGKISTATQRTTLSATTVDLVTAYGYDSAGHIATLTYPSGRMLTYTYDAGLPTALAVTAGASTQLLLSGIKHQPFGGPQAWSWAMASGSKTRAVVYDASGRPTRYPLGENLRDLSYDAAGRITAYTHHVSNTGAAVPALDQTFAYDADDRLTQVLNASSSWTAAYDANGNRTQTSSTGGTRLYGTSATSNRLNTLSNPARSISYQADGAATADNALFTSASYSPGEGNRIDTLTVGSLTASYVYNAQGQRVGKRVTSGGVTTTTLYAYDQAGHLLGEYDVSGKALREYVWLNDTPVAVFVPDPAGAGNPPLLYYIDADHLDTPRVVFDRNDKLRWRWMGDPFGTSAPEDNPAGLGAFTFNLRMPGQVFDAESGLFYNWHRYYDPSVGRYVQSDPIGLEGGSNTFSYVDGNPVSQTDAVGLCPACLLAVPYALEGAELAWTAYRFWRIVRTVGNLTKAWQDQCRRNECERIEAEIRRVAQEIRERYLAFLNDRRDLFNTAYIKRISKRGGSWVGHQQQFRDKQEELRKLIAEADENQCQVDPADRLLVNAVPPDRPADR